MHAPSACIERHAPHIVSMSIDAGSPNVPGAQSAFWVPVGRVRSKSNFRRGPHDRSWQSLRAFEDEVALLLRSHLPDSWELGPSDGPVATRPPVVACVMARTLLDAGNLSKSVLDAAQGIVFHTDASVRSVLELSERGGTGQHGLVGFALAGADCSRQDLLDVNYALASAMSRHW